MSNETGQRACVKQHITAMAAALRQTERELGMSDANHSRFHRLGECHPGLLRRRLAAHLEALEAVSARAERSLHRSSSSSQQQQQQQETQQTQQQEQAATTATAAATAAEGLAQWRDVSFHAAHRAETDALLRRLELAAEAAGVAARAPSLPPMQRAEAALARAAAELGLEHRPEQRALVGPTLELRVVAASAGVGSASASASADEDQHQQQPLVQAVQRHDDAAATGGGGGAPLASAMLDAELTEALRAGAEPFVGAVRQLLQQHAELLSTTGSLGMWLAIARELALKAYVDQLGEVGASVHSAVRGIVVVYMQAAPPSLPAPHTGLIAVDPPQTRSQSQAPPLFSLMLQQPVFASLASLEWLMAATAGNAAPDPANVRALLEKEEQNALTEQQWTTFEKRLAGLSRNQATARHTGRVHQDLCISRLPMPTVRSLRAVVCALRRQVVFNVLLQSVLSPEASISAEVSTEGFCGNEDGSFRFKLTLPSSPLTIVVAAGGTISIDFPRQLQMRQEISDYLVQLLSVSFNVPASLKVFGKNFPGIFF